MTTFICRLSICLLLTITCGCSATSPSFIQTGNQYNLGLTDEPNVLQVTVLDVRDDWIKVKTNIRYEAIARYPEQFWINETQITFIAPY